MFRWENKKKCPLVYVHVYDPVYTVIAQSNGYASPATDMNMLLLAMDMLLPELPMVDMLLLAMGTDILLLATDMDMLLSELPMVDTLYPATYTDMV